MPDPTRSSCRKDGMTDLSTMTVIQDEVQLAPGHYASIFISERPLDPDGYAEAMERVLIEARKIDGYIGYETLRNGKDGIFISYWRDRAAVDAWALHGVHRKAKARGVNEWYDAFRSVTCQIEQTRWFRREIS